MSVPSSDRPISNYAKRNHAWSVWEPASEPCTYRERFSLKEREGLMVEAGWVPIDSSCRDALTDLADARSHTSVLHHCSRAPYQECLVSFLRALILAAPRGQWAGLARQTACAHYQAPCLAVSVSSSASRAQLLNSIAASPRPKGCSAMLSRPLLLTFTSFHGSFCSTPLWQEPAKWDSAVLSNHSLLSAACKFIFACLAASKVRPWIKITARIKTKLAKIMVSTYCFLAVGVMCRKRESSLRRKHGWSADETAQSMHSSPILID